MNAVKKDPPEWVKLRLIRAVEEKEYNMCVNIAELLRMCCNMRYHEICEYVKEHTKLEVAEWDSFLQQGDEDGDD
tara:strand:+ start:18344 stop:18568 length:225 start_codon:yes stop_codon:yes gene_type:complete